MVRIYFNNNRQKHGKRYVVSSFMCVFSWKVHVIRDDKKDFKNIYYIKEANT